MGLTRAVDLEARRHRYAAGRLAEGTFAGELGALAEVAQPPAIPVWIDDGWLVTGEHVPAVERPSAKAVGKWTLAPGSWRNFSEAAAKGAGCRAADGGSGTRPDAAAGRLRTVTRGRRSAGSCTAGGPGTCPLYAAYHPVTGDQLLTNAPIEATDMGYAQPELLGHVRAVAPVTGSFGSQVTAVPWASRFGLAARRAMTDPRVEQVDDAMASIRKAVEGQLGTERPAWADVDPSTLVRFSADLPDSCRRRSASASRSVPSSSNPGCRARSCSEAT